jgi:hypothetical protein
MGFLLPFYTAFPDLHYTQNNASDGVQLSNFFLAFNNALINAAA